MSRGRSQGEKQQHTLFLELFQFCKEGRDVNDDARADDASALGIHEACRDVNTLRERQELSRRTARKEVERERLLHILWTHGDHDGVSRVVPSRASSTDVEIGGQDIDELALPLIAPLCTENDGGYVRAQKGAISLDGAR